MTMTGWGNWIGLCLVVMGLYVGFGAVCLGLAWILERLP